MKPLSLSRPHLIVMIGIPGAGKSTFAERFSEMFRAPLVSPAELQRVMFGTKYSKPAEEEKAIEIAHVLLGELFKTNQTIVYEDITGSRRHRTELAKIASQVDYTPLFVWVQTDSIEAGRRATRKIDNTLPITTEQFEHGVRRFNVPIASEKAVVISGKHTYTSQLKNVLKNVAAERADQPLRVPRRNSLIQ